jgi:hypothetical protein
VVDWGDIPTAAGALVSLGALIAAVIAARAARGVLDVELARDKDRDAAENRRQAEQVAAWPALVPINPRIAKSEITWVSRSGTAVISRSTRCMSHESP